MKAIVQVGDHRSGGFAARLGYPIEIVPLQNPYALKVGDTLQVMVLKDGQPLAGQRLYGSHEGHHIHGEDGAHIEPVATRTDADGRASVTLRQPGRWYLRLINMVAMDGPDLDYASEWATLTFEMRSGSEVSKSGASADSEADFPLVWIAGSVGVLLRAGLDPASWFVTGPLRGVGRMASRPPAG